MDLTANSLFFTCNSRFPFRRAERDKQAFRAWCNEYFTALGYSVAERKEGGGVNLLIGDLKSSAVVLSAHYDTSAKHRLGFYSTCENGVIPRVKQYATCLLSALSCTRRTNPQNANDNTSGLAVLLAVAAQKPKGVCYLLTDGEETGAAPSRAFYKQHAKDLETKLFLALDCVGRGRDFGVVYYRKYCAPYAKEIAKKLDGEKYRAQAVFPKGAFPTDADNFDKAVCISSFLKDKKGKRYFTDVHTPKDCVCDVENLDYLQEALCRYFREVLA